MFLCGSDLNYFITLGFNAVWWCCVWTILTKKETEILNIVKLFTFALTLGVIRVNSRAEGFHRLPSWTEHASK